MGFNDGISYSTDDPFIDHCWYEPGTYFISSSAIYPDGTYYSDSLIVFVNEAWFIEAFPIGELCPANDSISFNCPKVCSFSTVTYLIQQGSDFLLPFQVSKCGKLFYRGGNSYSRLGPPGDGYLNLVLSDNSFCYTEVYVCAEILEDPEAGFSTNPPAQNGIVEICEGQTVYFENTSTGAEHYEWILGTETSDEVNIEQTYSNPGTYEVTLIAYNACYCSDTTSVIVEVINAESPIVDCVGTICEGETVTYTSEADCGTFHWVVSGNGTVNDGGGLSDNFVTVAWGAGPLGTIDLTVENCPNVDYCLEPTFLQIPIISDNAQIEGPEIVCKGETTNYSLIAYEGTEYLWTSSSYATIIDGQGTNEITVQWFDGFIPTDVQWIAVDYNNCYLECGGSDSLFVNIKPEYYVAGPIEVCANSSSTYNSINAQSNMSLPAHWQVFAPDGSVAWSSSGATGMPMIDWPAQGGQYRLEVIADVPTDFCTDSYELLINVITPPPVVDNVEGEANICPGQPYAYGANSSQPNNNFSWEVNDGGVITTYMGNPY